MNQRKVKLAIGNSYEKLNDNESPISQNGIKKNHKFRCYVEVIGKRDDEVIKEVSFKMHESFSPRNYTKKYTPFQTTQTAYGAFEVRIFVTLIDGQKLTYTHQLCFQPGGRFRTEFVELNTPKPSNPQGLSPTPTFGVELELTSNSLQNIGQLDQLFALNGIDARSTGYTHNVTPFWKIVPDSSIACSINQPNCVKFEMVSPILSGEVGLKKIDNLLKVLQTVGLSVNKSTGFHVHIDAQQYNLGQLKFICYNFVKFEEAFDKLVPKSRRGSSNRFCQSNRALFGNDKNAWSKIDNCRTFDSLGEVINPGNDRYYKLNLQPLLKGRSTIEFRQHSGTANYIKLSCWIRTLVRFVNTCAIEKNNKHPWLTSSGFENNKSSSFKLIKLYDWIIKDAYLTDWATKRSNELDISITEEPCCNDCGSGSGIACNGSNPHPKTR